MAIYRIPLFGFEVRTQDDAEKEKQALKSPVAPITDDGAIVVSGSSHGSWRTYIDQEARAKNEVQLITRYRDVARSPEVDKAVNQISNQAIIVDEKNDPVEIVLDNVAIPSKTKDKVRQEFEYLLGLLDFRRQGYDIFRKWYIDGRLFLHLVIDDAEGKTKEGVKDLRYIDPRKIKKVREEIDKTEGIQPFETIFKKYDEYYIYSDKGITDISQGLKIAKDSIAYIHSGLVDHKNGMILSYLHKVLKIAQNLQMLENSVVIYRLARAPERRVFYIDVGGMPPQKAEQYMNAVKNNFKNTLSYDNTTGDVVTNKRFSPMLEDFFMARRSDGKATEITTLAAGALTNQMDDVEYFKRKLYESLDVPVSRMSNEDNFSFGRPTEISRDEVDFNKFVGRLRTRFSDLFNQLLEVHLAMKDVMTRGDFQEIKKDISYDFVEDNYFSELKETEIFINRINILNQTNAYLGKYFSKSFIVDKVLRMTEKEWDQMKKQIEEEKTRGEITDQDMMQQNQPIYGQDFNGMDMGGGGPDDFQQQLPPPGGEEEEEEEEGNPFGQRKRLAAERSIDKANMLIEKVWEEHMKKDDPEDETS